MLYAFLLFVIATVVESAVVMIVTYVAGGMILGFAWDRVMHGRRHDVHAESKRSLNDLSVPSFRRDSWYGRLYKRAYGEDRRWLIAWIPKSVLSRIIWTQGDLEPPKQQPFVSEGPQASLCQVFHRIMFAAWLYVPFIAQTRLSQLFWQTRMGRLIDSSFDRLNFGKVRIGRMIVMAGLFYGVLAIWTFAINEYVESREAKLFDATYGITRDMAERRKDDEIAQVLPVMVENVRWFAVWKEEDRKERCGSSAQDLASRGGILKL